MTLVASNVLLWVAVLVLGVVVLALARQVGVLYGRVAPMGALAVERGPKVGEQSPAFELVDILGHHRRIGYEGRHSQLLFFLSPHCPICKKLLPILQSTAQRERDWLEVVLASDGPQPEHLTFYHDRHLEGFTYVLSERLGRAFEVARLPYAVLIDGRGIVRAKGLVNSREHLESLFTASELGVGSAQEWLERQDAEAGMAERTGAGRV